MQGMFWSSKLNVHFDDLFLDVLSIFGTGLPDFVLPINDADLEQPVSEAAEAHNVWQYFTVTNYKKCLFSWKGSQFSWKGSQKSGSKEGGAVTAYFFNENGISFVANSSDFGRMSSRGILASRMSILASRTALHRFTSLKIFVLLQAGLQADNVS